MSEQVLQLILEKLNQIESEISTIKQTMVTKNDVAEFPFIVRAVKEIDDRTKNIEESVTADIELLKKDVWQLRKKA